MTHEGKRIALLVGSPLGLSGIDRDIEAIRERLELRGFQCRRCVDEDATRARILEELKGLIGLADAGDAIVVYYSGHGGRCRLVERQGVEPGPARNYLVPMDHDRERSFRGIADFELALLFHDLAQKTHNITVILDCCHASTLVREGEARPREQLRRWEGESTYLMPEDMMARYAEYQRRKDELHPDSNLHVVRLVATAAGSPAYQSDHGVEAVGYLTAELCAALDDTLHARISWDTLVRRIRERIMARRRSTTQRPELEGPRARIPFSLETEVDIVDRSTLVYDPRDGTAWLRAGKLQGLALEDEFEVLGDGHAVVARVKVQEIFDDHARVGLEIEKGADPPMNGSVVAFTRFKRQKKIWLDDTTPYFDEICEAIGRHPRLALTRALEQANFRIVVKEQEIHIEGSPLLHRMPKSATELNPIEFVRDLDELARTEILDEELSRAKGLGCCAIEWQAQVFATLPDHHEARALRDGESLPVGTRIFAEFRHMTRARPALYINVLARGIRGSFELLNVSQPAGVQLRSPEGSTPTLARVPTLDTMVSTWPDPRLHVPKLAEELIFIASLRPIDIRGLLSSRANAVPRRREERHTYSDTSLIAYLQQDLRWEVRRFSLFTTFFTPETEQCN